MTPSELRGLLTASPLVLTEGSMYERLRRDPRVSFDPDVAHGALIYDDTARAMLEETHGEYLDVAARHQLPMLVTSSTWRASEDRVARSRFAGGRINQDNVAFARGLAASRSTSQPPLVVLGQLGPRGNAYRPDEALSADDAAGFHRYQVEALAEAGPDLVVAATLPALSEARGIARLLDGTGLPYLLSFVVRDAGTLLDGTPLVEACDRIDSERDRPPLGYLVNCVHPTVLSAALDHAGRGIAGRVLGLRANTSTKRPEELEDLEDLVTEPPGALAEHMLRARRRHGFKIVGGCCGTGTDHIEALAQTCKEET